MNFRNEFWFLSNMFPAEIKLGSVVYSCAEAAFQAAKLQDRSARKMFAGINGFEAKKLGRQIQLRADWDSIKLDVMKWVLTEKFRQHPELMEKLKAIRSEIVEDNTWGDRFWGRCGSIGENHLGKILMQIRDGE